MYDYAIRFEQDDDGSPGVAVFCRDLPQLNSFGNDREHAIREALDAIDTTLSLYVDARKPIPVATDPKEGEQVIRLPAVTVAKIALWNEMMKRGMRKADLCKLLGIAQTQGDRLVDFVHNTKMEALEAALAALHAEVRVTPPDPHWIRLPYGGAQAGFYVGRLADEFDRRGISEMVTGATKENLDSVNPDSSTICSAPGTRATRTRCKPCWRSTSNWKRPVCSSTCPGRRAFGLRASCVGCKRKTPARWPGFCLLGRAGVTVHSGKTIPKCSPNRQATCFSRSRWAQ